MSDTPAETSAEPTTEATTASSLEELGQLTSDAGNAAAAQHLYTSRSSTPTAVPMRPASARMQSRGFG